MKQPTNEMQRSIEWMKYAKGFNWNTVESIDAQFNYLDLEVEEVKEAFDNLMGCIGSLDDLDKFKDKLVKELSDVIFICAVLQGQLGYDPVKALAQINDENFTKFVDGKPIIDEKGHIKKGPNHVKCDISKARVTQ